MRIRLIAVGQRLDAWVNSGFEEYARRLPREWHFELQEINASRRGKGQSVERARSDEGDRMLAAIPAGSQIIALDEHGNSWDTCELADQVRNWMSEGQNIALLIGGADGLSPACKEQAHRHWSLSRLTLPHGLARVLVSEQLYRAWSLTAGHPYHRA